MEIRKYIIVLIATFFLINIAYGQLPTPMENYPTPNVASLGTFGDIPVSLYTGQPDISIPLYEINEDGISIPITLSYNVSSVKANTHSSWVGLGWSLSSGGYITRTVRGCMDESMARNGYACGFYNHTSKLGAASTVDGLIKHSQYFMEERSTIGYELMADEFRFNFGEYSGTFYLDEKGRWRVISDYNIKVSFDENDGFLTRSELRPEIITSQWLYNWYCDRYFNKFTITTPDGIKYIFGGKYATEYSISYYHKNTSELIPTTWYLSEIHSLNGNKIKFTYEAGAPICELKYTPSKTELHNVVCTPQKPQNVGSSALSGYLMFPVYLKKIDFSLGSIDFVSVPDVYEYKQDPDFLKPSEDNVNPFKAASNDKENYGSFFNLSSNEKNLGTAIRDRMIWRQLHAVSINAKAEGLSRTFYFQYSSPGKRRLLSLLSERKGDYEEHINKVQGGGVIYNLYVLPPSPEDYVPQEYKFEYDVSETMPEFVHASEDHWGYYNGKPFSLTATVETVIANKTSVLKYNKAETLKSIKYPTGGETRFEYEMNNYSQCVSDSKTSLQTYSGSGGGLRIRSIESYTASNSLAFKKRYYYNKGNTPDNSTTNSKSSGILRAKPTYTVQYYSNDQLKYWDIFKGIQNEGDAVLILTHAGGFTRHGTNNNTPVVGYSNVIEETIDSDNNSNGYVRYQFSNYDQDIWGNSHLDESYLISTVKGNEAYSQFSGKSQERGKLLSKEYYNSDKKLVESVMYQYGVNKNMDHFETVEQEVLFFVEPYHNMLL